MGTSMHALLQYILLFDDDIVTKHTFYIIGYGVDRNVAEHLPSCYIGTKPTGNKMSFRRTIDKILIRFFKYAKFPFLRTAKIYALDWGATPSFIGRREYSLLADCPLFMSHNMQPSSGEYVRQKRKQHSIMGRLEGLLYGKLAIMGHGDNSQCREIFLTEENVSPVLTGKLTHIKSLKEMWDNASEYKRNLIKTVFNVTNADVDVLNGRSIMFMTQALITDNILSEKEYVDLLKKIFSHYDNSQLIIKLHPRDKFDYKYYFPDIEVYNKPVNIQLLVLMGTRVSKAVTICSSSVNAFPETVDVDWYGVNIHPNLKSFYGDTLKPYRKYTHIQL